MKRLYQILKSRSWRLEWILLLALLTAGTCAAIALVSLRQRQEQRARVAATETVLKEGNSLLDTICGSGFASVANPTPILWRQFSMQVDSALAVRPEIQSFSIVRNGVKVFHRQAGGVPSAGQTASSVGLLRSGLPSVPRAAVVESDTDITQGTVETGADTSVPVFVITRTETLDDGTQVVSEATFKREAVSAEEKIAQEMVASLFLLSILVLVVSFAVCALVLTLAVVRDRRRERKERQEEHLAFSGVLANGILHDFRNPMSAVRLDAQMLTREMARAEGFRPERVHSLAERIARTMGRMDKIFTEFLFLAKPADEKPETTELAEIVRDCADTLGPRLEQAGVGLRKTVGDELPPVVAYPFALRRALMNVLVNAVQFAPRGSEIEVAASAVRPDEVRLDILDRGPGVPDSRKEAIFEMFETGRPEGTGLGLFLARTAIQRCGGEIVVLDREGGGSDFRITLRAGERLVEEPLREEGGMK
ncbi:MAG: hypothetical protein IJR99_00065 [Kiritimatiellae bacterium]|nr:hypothetical protein [Kiritimatiellia bacterium]